jgi:tRNA(Leu) C34 or U34 (ribose-2'-O)-methylase TrmL
MNGNELVTLTYDRIIDSRETGASWCFVFGDETVFLPKSQVEDIIETRKEVVIPRWLMKARELEGYEG